MTKRKTIPPKLKLKVLKRDNYKCLICGKSPSTHPELSLEVDHILPVSKGGINDLENLQTLCIYCNRGKGNDDSLNIEIKDHGSINRCDRAIERVWRKFVSNLGRVRRICEPDRVGWIKFRTNPHCCCLCIKNT